MALLSWVRRAINCARSPSSINAACCSSLLTATNCIVGRLMAPLAQLPRPEMRSAAGLHPDHGSWQLGKKCQHLTATQLPAQHRPLGGIDPVQLKKMLRRIHSNADNLVHGRLPCLRFATASFWHTDAVGGRLLHQPQACVV